MFIRFLNGCNGYLVSGTASGSGCWKFVVYQYHGLMKNNILATESFATGKSRYFLDFKKAVNNRNLIQLTRSDEQRDGSYVRHHVCVFEDDFPLLVQAMSSLFHHAAYLDTKALGSKVADMELPHKIKGIKSWEPDMRPREKLLSKGAAALSNAELLALLVGSGSVKETAVDLCSRMLDALDGNLERLSTVDYVFFGKFAGMGLAKSDAIIGAMELSRRLILFKSGS